MKIKKIIIENFRAFRHEEIEFNDFNCIIGKNDSGKSTILAALEWFFDPKKELKHNDYAVAGYDWTENTHSAYDPATFEEYTYTEKEYIYDDFYASVTVYFSGITIPESSEHIDYIFGLDFISNNEICLKKSSLHPLSRFSDDGSSYYSIQIYPYKSIGKILSLCSLDELINKYNVVGKSADMLCLKLNELKITRDSNKGSRIALNSLIRKEEKEIKKQLCNDLYSYYDNQKDAVDIKWLEYDKEHCYPFYLDWLDAYIFYIYTSKTPISSYLNSLFTPNNARRLYNPIEDARKRTASKLTEMLKEEGITERIQFNRSSNINIFAENGIELKLGDFSIPLSNRGEGLQLKIKNVVWRLLARIQSNNQNCIFAFEEPETHLHPSAQREMYESIKTLAKNSNYQIILTTHSPYIVKELAKDNIKPIVVKRDENLKASKISKLDERVLPYVSMNEINFIAFDEPSIEYHQELYGRIEIEWLNESNGNKIGDVINSVINLPNYQFRNDLLCILKDFYTELHPNTTIPSDKELVKLYIKSMNFVSPDKDEKNDVSICYCVRNSIDHPCKKNLHYQNDQWVNLSTKILYSLLKTINRIKKDKISSLLQSLHNSKTV